MKRALAVLSLLPALTACEGWEDVNLDPYKPTVSFQDLDVNDVNWEGVDADFVFAVENPNPVSVELAHFDYGLAFEQVDWLSGDNPDGLVLAASGGSDLALPVAFQYSDLWEMVQAIRGKDDIDFGLSGSFGFDSPAGVITLPYDEAGDFPAPRKPDIQLNTLQLQSLSLSGAELELTLDVDNAHGSRLDFLGLDYDLALAGVDLGQGSVQSLGSVEGDSSKRLAIPLEISFQGAAGALYSAFQGEKLKVDLDATVDVDTPFGVLPLAFDESGQVELVK
ncbi:MAG: LEA type 2 family protein [Myxococcota bacterium]|nr:LEA type 2 family protein [Myxococcota bacterium]